MSIVFVMLMMNAVENVVCCVCVDSQFRDQKLTRFVSDFFLDFIVTIFLHILVFLVPSVL